MTTNEAPLTTDDAPADPTSAQSAREYIAAYLRRLRGGDLGPLPILVGIIIIATIFEFTNHNFLSPVNFVNILLQMAGITTLAYGVVFVLLLGEIDLSIGYVSAVAACLTTILLRPPFGWAWYSAVAAGLLAVLAIGFFQGFLITFFQLPSFIVTLAGLLAWSGLVLLLVGEGGTINIQNAVIRDLARNYLPREVSWILLILLLLGYIVMQYTQWRSRKARGLSTKPRSIMIAQVAITSILLILIVAICNMDRGVPLVGAGIFLMLVILTFIAENTRFGRYVYAVGGNKEAARRAGIRVERIRLYVFMLSSFMAGLGGIIFASRLGSVATNSGGGDLLLNAIASAVIGGTSLFGGRGQLSSALLGSLIIAGVINGMTSVTENSGVQSIITGAVLVLAVIVDSLSRRSQKRSGLA